MSQAANSEKESYLLTAVGGWAKDKCIHEQDKARPRAPIKQQPQHDYHHYHQQHEDARRHLGGPQRHKPRQTGQQAWMDAFELLERAHVRRAASGRKVQLSRHPAHKEARHRRGSQQAYSSID